MTRSLTARFDGLKSQYRKDLEPLRQQREALIREINELKEARDIFLEETTALNARNEELADLNAQIARQIESAVSESTLNMDGHMTDTPASGSETPYKSKTSLFGSKNKSGSVSQIGSGPPSNSPSFSSVNTAVTTIDERDEFGRATKTQFKSEVAEPVPAPASKKFKWFGAASSSKDKKNKVKTHNFKEFSVLKFDRCDHCGDKMWGPGAACNGGSDLGRCFLLLTRFFH